MGAHVKGDWHAEHSLRHRRFPNGHGGQRPRRVVGDVGRHSLGRASWPPLTLLSSPFIVVTLGYYGHERNYQIAPEEARDLRHWVLVANAKGRYSRGPSETLLDQDLATLRQGGGADALLDRLRLQVGRLDIAPEELEGRNQRSALFKTMFLAFRATGAKDWESNLAIALGHRGAQHRLQFHHIFPKAVLKGNYTAREADDIANLAFIGGKTNRQISDKAPSQYFPALIEKAGTAAFDALHSDRRRLARR